MPPLHRFTAIHFPAAHSQATGTFLRTNSWMISHRWDALRRLSSQPLVLPSRPMGTCSGVGAFPRLPWPFPGHSSPAGSLRPLAAMGTGAAACTLPHMPVGRCNTPREPNPPSASHGVVRRGCQPPQPPSTPSSTQQQGSAAEGGWARDAGHIPSGGEWEPRWPGRHMRSMGMSSAAGNALC